MPNFKSFLSATLLAVLLLAVSIATPPEARAQTTDDKIFTRLLFDQLEYAPGPSGQPISLEAIGYVGGDFNRLWLRAEGEQSTIDNFGGGGEAETEVLYGRLISPFFDVVGGARVDTRWGEGVAGDNVRGHLAVGLQGVAPYMFEVEPTLYVSQAGNVSAEFTAEYHFLFTQRLTLVPEVEASAAVQEVPEWGVGSGFNDLGLSARLRYELSRKFAPYVGYGYDWAFDSGGTDGSGAFVFGVRMWR
jgi:copper resistance protein B